MNETDTPEMHGSSPKRLVRTPDGKIAGVAAGIGHYLGIDPTIVRIAFLVLVFAGGVGILLYLACWLLMPKGEAGSARPATPVDTWTAVGIVGLIAGVGLLVGWHGIGDLGRVAVAVALVVGGVLLIGRRTGDAGGPDDSARPVTPAPPPGDAPTDGEGPEPDVEPADAPAADEPTAIRTEAAPAASVPRRAPMTALVLGLLAVALAALLGGVLDGRFDVTWSAALAGGLVVVGAGLVVASVTGGAPWLFPVGAVLAVALLAAAVVEPLDDRGIGSQDYVPAAFSDLATEYRHGIGELVVDLAAVRLDGATRSVDVRLGIGRLEVIVPDDVAVELDGHVGMGRLEGPDGSETEGVGHDLSIDLDGTPGAGTIVLDLDVGIGEGVVTRG